MRLALVQSAVRSRPLTCAAALCGVTEEPSYQRAAWITAVQTPLAPFAKATPDAEPTV
jgi:hypothetical protein